MVDPLGLDAAALALLDQVVERQLHRAERDESSVEQPTQDVGRGAVGAAEHSVGPNQMAAAHPVGGRCKRATVRPP